MKRLTCLALLSLFLCWISNPAVTQARDATSVTVQQSDSASAAASAAQEEAGRIAVPQPSEEAMRYYRSGNLLWIVNALWGLLIPGLFLFTGFSARMRDWAQTLGRKWFFVIAIYVTLYLLITFVIDLPLAYYAGFVRQHAYDLSNQTLGKWFGDALKGLALGIVLGVLFLWIPYLLLKKSPRRWWLYTGVAMIPFIFFLLLVSPIVIDPLFNDFGPMTDKQLESDILALAHRAGIDADRVYEVNKSVDTETVNAYVSGFMGTQRIVLWDTIIQKLGRRELLFVMGHEMGHYVLRHAVWLVLFFSLLILLALYAAHRSAGTLIDRFKTRWRFDQLSDIASLPLLVLLLNAFTLVATPIAFAYTRHLEHESDRFGLEITRDNHACATAFVKLQAENLANPRPGPLYKLWRASHPPLGERIDFCNRYRPWESGEALRYGHRFGDG
ncbi:MAG: M48 family metallopeptidase [Gemmatimonadales bacterium]|jgi:Zn-dependent protease with chaperone function